MANLEIMYRDGVGVPQDAAEAARWNRLAQDQERADREFLYALWARTDQSIPPDDSEAVARRRVSANRGDAEAQFDLGIIYATGRGVPPDVVEAHKWLNLALAATQSSGEFRDRMVEIRDGMVEELTPEQLAEVERLAREWQPTQ